LWFSDGFGLLFVFGLHFFCDSKIVDNCSKSKVTNPVTVFANLVANPDNQTLYIDIFGVCCWMLSAGFCLLLQNVLKLLSGSKFG